MKRYWVIGLAALTVALLSTSAWAGGMRGRGRGACMRRGACPMGAGQGDCLRLRDGSCMDCPLAGTPDCPRTQDRIRKQDKTQTQDQTRQQLRLRDGSCGTCPLAGTAAKAQTQDVKGDQTKQQDRTRLPLRLRDGSCVQ